MKETAVEITDLRVDYGDLVAVRDLSLTIPKGEIMGWVGPNGAGKTSTFRVMTMLMDPTYGEVKLNGMEISLKPQQVRRILGYMPDMAPVPTDLKIWEFLDFYAHAHKLGGGKKRRRRWEECLEMVNLSGKRDAFCRELSRGQTQRLLLAKTLLHRPEILILDEPASGLDPLSRRDLRNTLQDLARGGTTVLISSHILSELDEMCSSLCILNLGKLVAHGTADEIRMQFGDGTRRLSLGVLGLEQDLCLFLQSDTRVSDLEAKEGEVAFDFAGTPHEQVGLIRNLANEGFELRTVSEEKFSLEELLEKSTEVKR